MHQKTHTMTTDMKVMTWRKCLSPKIQLLWMLHHLDHIVPKGDNDSSNEDSEETDTLHPLAELLEQFWQLKDQFTSLKSANHPSTPMTELTHLTDKLQYLTVMLLSHPACSLMRNQYKKLSRHKWTPCAQHRERQTSE